MYISEEGVYQYFVVIGGETHLLETRDGSNPVENPDYFVEKLNEEFLMTPSWEAVGAVCFSNLRQRTVTTYITSEIHYDQKKPIYEAAKEVSSQVYPNTFHETVDVPGNEFPNLEGVQTLGRNENGHWEKKDLPVYRAIFANKKEGSDGLKVDGYEFEFDDSNQPYISLSPSEERFIHFCSSEEAERVEKKNEIEVGDSLWTASILWGGDIDIPSDSDTAIVFQTSQAPSFAHPDSGALWRENISIDDFSTMNSSVAGKAKPLSPIPEPEKLKKKIDVDFSNNEEPRPYIKYSKLPLGEPGGPCHLIYNIEDTNLPEEIKEDLKEDVRDDGEIEKEHEHTLYDDWKSISIDIKAPFSKVELTGHAQYRMDQRSISKEDIESAFSEFGRWFNYRKQNPNSMSPEDRERIKGLQRGKKVKFDANKTGLTLVFRMGNRKDELALITTFWTGKPDPDAPSPGECTHILERQSMARNVVSKCLSGCECEGECDCDECDCDESSSYLPSELIKKYHGWASHYYPLRQ